jgi:hypothetical protein
LYLQISSRYFLGISFVKLKAATVAPRLNGAKKLLHAHFAQPGAERL